MKRFVIVWNNGELYSTKIHLVTICRKGQYERKKKRLLVHISISTRITTVERLRLRQVIVAVEGIPAIARIVLWKRQGKMSLLPFPPLVFRSTSLHPIPFSFELSFTLFLGEPRNRSVLIRTASR